MDQEAAYFLGFIKGIMATIVCLMLLMLMASMLPFGIPVPVYKDPVKVDPKDLN